MAGDVIRVGVVGAGGITTLRHLPGLQAISGVKIVGVANRSRESGERIAQRFSIPKVYERWSDLVTAGDVDAVVIGTWPYMHCPITLAALDADRHVMCQARLAMDSVEARLMRDAAREKPHLVAQVVPSPFTLKVDRTVKRLIAEGFVGDVLAIEARAGGAFLDPEAPLHWRQDFDLSGYNIMTMGIWYEAVLRWVGEATRVVAMGKTYAKMRKDATGAMRAVRIPEHVDVVADLACGAQLHLQVSSVAGLAGPPELWVFGSKGTLRFSEDRLFAGKKGDAALVDVAIPPEEAGGWRVEEEFVNAIRGKEKITHTTFDDGVKYIDFTEAVTISMATGEAVPLPL